MLSLQSQLPDCSATLDRLNELKLSRRSLKYLEVIFKVTFSLALPSWLLKFPIIFVCKLHAVKNAAENSGKKCG